MFKKIRIANLGEIACCTIRTAKNMGIAAAAAYAVPALACSSVGTQGHAYDADVIVKGNLIDVDKSIVDEIVTKKVIKGSKSDRYAVEWLPAGDNECAAFEWVEPLKRGIYFLKQHNGKYYVIHSEKRWNKRWKTGS